MTRRDAQEREAVILRALRLNAAIRVADLAAELGVTTETIRRDLTKLRDSGLIRRMYGGAVLPPVSDEPMVNERAAVRVAEREAIARLAASLVQGEDVLMIDAGSTTALFARALAELTPGPLMAVTNSFKVATSLAANAAIRVVMCPGDYTPREGGVTGAETVAFLSRFRASAAFIGASGLTRDGPTEAHSPAASVKRAMLRASRRTILLADASKFEQSATELVCPLPQIADLVTDIAPGDQLAGALSQAGVKVHVAHAESGRDRRVRAAAPAADPRRRRASR